MAKGKPPRPWATKEDRATPRCEKCAHLVCVPEPICSLGRILDPVNCPDYVDAGKDSESHLGTLRRRGDRA